MLDPALREQEVAASPGPPAPDSPVPAPRRNRLRRWLLILLVATLVGALVAGLGFLMLAGHLDNNIRKEQVKDLGVRPIGGQGLNILLIGSDSREGENAKYGNVDGERGDVTLLLHLSGDSRSATAVSIPRDSMVQIPSCTRADDTVLPPTFDTFNAAYARGGPGCTLKTVEQTTGVRIAHFVVVDFTGFKSMVDALGTVPICVPTAINDRDSGLNISAGLHDVNGEVALAFVRVRHVGDGSDLSRIKRQQAFLSAMIQKATSAGVLTNPKKLFSFLDAATSSMVTDADFSGRQLSSLANSVRGIGLDRISFVTVPVEAYPRDTNRVQWSSSAHDLWRSLSADQPLDAAATKSGVPVVRTAPQAIRVRVLNGADANGLATRAAADLRAQGFQVVSVGKADTHAYAESVVRHTPAYDESGRTLTRSVPGSRAEVTTSGGRTLDLVVGANYSRVQKVKVADPATALPTRRANENVCV